MRIVILGGGLTGLTTAYKLSKQKNNITLLEKEKNMGGALSSTYKNGFFIEDYYHHVFSGDKFLFKLLKELDLINKLEWKETTTGFYHKGKFLNLSSPQDLIFFKMLNIIDKFYLSKFLLKIKLIKNINKYDKVSAKEFIINNSSKKVYSVFFEPLLKSKFGENKEKVSAAWLIDRLSLRSDRKTSGERLGYLKGGFSQLIKKLENKIIENNGKILTSITINTIDQEKKIITTNKGKFKYDKLISTIPPDFLHKLTNIEEKRRKYTNYQGSICVLLSLNKKISDYYWNNIMEDLIFGVIIEHTNYIPKNMYNNENLVYLGSYYDVNDKVWEEKEEVIFKKYLADLNKIKAIKKEDINWYKVSKYPYAGLMYTQGCLNNLYPFKTSDKNILAAGMFNSFPERSINKSIEFGEKLVKLTMKKENPEICITLPVYNEEKDLANSVNKLKEFLKNNFNYPYFIVIADNASIDNTKKIGENLSKKFKDVEYLYIPRKGRGFALRNVWTKYNADIYSYMDIDLSTELEAFPKMIDLIHKKEFDLATGNRLSKKSKVERSFKRELLSRGYNKILKFAFNHKLSDAQCGFKAISKDVAKNIIPKVKDNNWFFDTELFIKSKKAGYKIAELPVTWVEDSNTKVKNIETITDYLKNIKRVRKELKNL